MGKPGMALFAIALLMSVIALGFVVTPLVSSQHRQSKGSANLPILGILVVFGLGIALYGVIGRPDAQSYKPSSVAESSLREQGTGNAEKAGSIASLLTGLEQRLEGNPKDGKGWLLLAQSYDALGRLDEAASAYDKAVSLGLSNEALASRLSARSDEAGRSIAIHGRVGVDPTIQGLIEPDAAVYVIAKSSGSPMPLAVLRRSAEELPFDFVLSEEDSMVKGAGMAGESALTVSVKVSRTGDALASESGFEASVPGVDPRSDQPLDIVIGRRADP